MCVWGVLIVRYNTVLHRGTKGWDSLPWAAPVCVFCNSSAVGISLAVGGLHVGLWGDPSLPTSLWKSKRQGKAPNTEKLHTFLETPLQRDAVSEHCLLTLACAIAKAYMWFLSCAPIDQQAGASYPK